MNYKIGIGAVLLLQIAISLLTIFSSTGNGSFAGLGAMILAIYGIPITLITNFFIIRSHKKCPRKSNAVILIAISSVLPCLQLTLFFLQIKLDL